MKDGVCAKRCDHLERPPRTFVAPIMPPTFCSSSERSLSIEKVESEIISRRSTSRGNQSARAVSRHPRSALMTDAKIRSRAHPRRRRGEGGCGCEWKARRCSSTVIRSLWGFFPHSANRLTAARSHRSHEIYNASTIFRSSRRPSYRLRATPRRRLRERPLYPTLSLHWRTSIRVRHNQYAIVLFNGVGEIMGLSVIGERRARAPPSARPVTTRRLRNWPDFEHSCRPPAPALANGPRRRQKYGTPGRHQRPVEILEDDLAPDSPSGVPEIRGAGGRLDGSSGSTALRQTATPATANADLRRLSVGWTLVSNRARPQIRAIDSVMTIYPSPRDAQQSRKCSKSPHQVAASDAGGGRRE